MPNEEILTMKGIVKSYQMGDELQIVLKGIDFQVRRGEFLSILGPSGSGKSTMMNIIGCLDTPNAGEYYLSGQRIADLDNKELARIRCREIGFVFQQFQLLQRVSAVQNVELPMVYSKTKPADRHRRALDLLDRVGLSDKTINRPNQLSGGQQQRVAIARALANNPTILLADEPTGALDQTTGRQVLDLFTALNKEGHTIIMITHNETIAQYASRIVQILDGELFEGEVA